MDLLDDMRTYLRVADLASFTQAAASLGVPKTRVSMAVQRLEATLGTRLLHRTTRRVSLTPDGQTYAERCRDLLADIDELQTLFVGDLAPLRGRLRVDMPLGIARKVVIPRLGEFLAAHPALSLELSATDRRVDLVREGFDCVVRVGQLAESSLVARPLGQYRLGTFASPDYLARQGVPRALDDLASHVLVHYAPMLGTRVDGFEYLLPSGERAEIAMAGRVTVNNSDAYVSAAIAGLGLIQVPQNSVRDAMASGALVEVLPQLAVPPMPVSVLYPHRRHLPRRVQAFVGWLSDLLTPLLEPPHRAAPAMPRTPPRRPARSPSTP